MYYGVIENCFVNEIIIEINYFPGNVNIINISIEQIFVSLSGSSAKLNYFSSSGYEIGL